MALDFFDRDQTLLDSGNKKASQCRYNFIFSADKAFKEKLSRLAEVLGVNNAEKNMREVIEKALDLALDRKDPKKKLEQGSRREKLMERKKSCPAENNSDPSKNRSRYIPSEVRERVLERASYRCEFRGPKGYRCTQRTGLEIDHKDPFARGGLVHRSSRREQSEQ